MNVNQCVVQVTGRLKTPAELMNWKVWLEKKGYVTAIRKYIVKQNSESYALFRSLKDGECNIPSNGYWKLIRNTFWRVDENPQKVTDSVCPRCGAKHKDTKGEKTFCKNCKPIARKNSEGFNCEPNRSKIKSKSSHK